MRSVLTAWLDVVAKYVSKPDFLSATTDLWNILSKYISYAVGVTFFLSLKTTHARFTPPLKFFAKANNMHFYCLTESFGRMAHL